MKNTWEAVLPLIIIKFFVQCGLKTSKEGTHYTCVYVFIHKANFLSNKDFELLKMFTSEMNRKFLFHLRLIKVSCKILRLTILYILQ